MSHITVESVANIDPKVLTEYINTGSSKCLSPTHQVMIDLCRKTWGLLMQHPNKITAAHKLESLTGLPYQTCLNYVNFTQNTWGKMLDVNRSFLDAFLVEHLTKAIGDPRARPSDKAKNLATLQKYLSNMPQTEIDPSLKNDKDVIIMFQMGEKSLSFSQAEFRALPKRMQEMFMDSVTQDITDAEVEEILEG